MRVLIVFIGIWIAGCGASKETSDTGNVNSNTDDHGSDADSDDGDDEDSDDADAGDADADAGDTGEADGDDADAGDTGEADADDADAGDTGEADGDADDADAGDTGEADGDADDADAGDTGTVEPPPPTTPGHIVAYFAEWGIYERDYQVSDIPADQLTHINYAFADLNADGECLVYDSWAALEREGGNYAKLRALREAHPHLKVLISVGGWTLSTHFSSVASTAEGRTAMVESCVNFMTTHGFDGLDIDWEYPVGGGLATGMPADTENYTLLMAEFRDALDALGGGHLLSIAAPAGPSTIAHMDLPGLSASLDWFNVMTYDMHGGWEMTTNFQAPLYPSSTSPAVDEALLNVDAVIQTYIDAGVPVEKIVMGFPFYGRAWSGVPSTDDGLYQPATDVAPGSWEPGLYDYSDIVSMMADPVWIGSFHEESMVPWAYNPTTGVFITYDDPTSFGHKLDYLVETGLAGAMFWELSNDTDDHILVDTLHDRLGD